MDGKRCGNSLLLEHNTMTSAKVQVQCTDFYATVPPSKKEWPSLKKTIQFIISIYFSCSFGAFEWSWDRIILLWPSVMPISTVRHISRTESFLKKIAGPTFTAEYNYAQICSFNSNLTHINFKGCQGVYGFEKKIIISLQTRLK